MNDIYESGKGFITLEDVGKKETIERQCVELLYEELETLNQGKTIALLENDKGETIIMLKGPYYDREEELRKHLISRGVIKDGN